MKVAVSDWFTTASANTNCDGTNIGENCPAGNVNDAIRKVMAAVRSLFSDFWIGVFGATDQATARAALGAAQGTNATNSIAAVTPATDTFPYFTGASTAATTALTAFARTLLDDADANAFMATLGFSAGSNANGYWAKRPDGTGGSILECYGTKATGGVTPEGQLVVNLPSAFADTNYVFVPLGFNGLSIDNLDASIQGVSKATGSVTIYIQWTGTPGTSSNFTSIDFLAIGKAP